TTLETIAQQNKVNQKITLRPKEDKTIKNKDLNLQIQTTGQFNDLLDYLNDLEKMNYYLNLDLVRFTKPDNQGQNNNLLQLNLAGTAFYKL
ncbi:MAG: hypothetical protein ACOZAJ_01360, partial [Patescibacteria group bacterium]